MNFSLPLLLLCALIGLFVNVAVGQNPCSSSTRIRCNIHCRSFNMIASCGDGECVCADRTTAAPSS
uniref:Invertebrate defensins family profile domain-containing protein n=1 Tax=Anopheles farauti TaxID=69004 RepID=A0A2C9GW54_9DIPT